MSEVKYPWVVVVVGDGYAVARNGRDGVPEMVDHYYPEADNVLSGACKVILDALQVAGIIPNDSPRYVHLRPERFQSEDKSYYTVVEIEEAGE